MTHAGESGIDARRRTCQPVVPGTWQTGSGNWRTRVQPNRTVVVVVDDTPAARHRLRELLAETEPSAWVQPTIDPKRRDAPLVGDPDVLDDPIVVRMLCERPLRE